MVYDADSTPNAQVRATRDWMRHGDGQGYPGPDMPSEAYHPDLPTLHVRTDIALFDLEDRMEKTQEYAEDGRLPEDAAEITEVTRLDEECPLVQEDTHFKVGREAGPEAFWRVRLSGVESPFFMLQKPVYTRTANGGIEAAAILVCAAKSEADMETLMETLSASPTGFQADPGAYTAFSTPVGMRVTEKKIADEPEVIHPNAEPFLSSIDTFFDNPGRYCRFDRSGMRTWLVYGTHGTGKSTLMKRLAERNKEDRAVVFAADNDAMQRVAAQAAARKKPLVIVASEAEQLLTDGDGSVPDAKTRTTGASESTLNFLDGVEQPQNEAGIALVLTTNRPNRLSGRILNRSGRINDRYEIGPISGDHAIRCARHYLPDTNEATEEGILEAIGSVTSDGDGLAGADIMSIIRRAEERVIEAGDDAVIGDQELKGAAEELAEEMEEVQEYDSDFDEGAHDYDSEKDMSGGGKVGF